MRDSDYYPAGAYNDPNAPYNEVELPEIEVTATVNIAMTKDIVVTTDQYTMDEEGHRELLTSYSDIEELIGKQHKSIPELLSSRSQTEWADAIDPMVSNPNCWANLSGTSTVNWLAV